MTVEDGPLPLSLNGMTWNVYCVLGMRPVAVNVLISVPVIDSVVLVDSEVDPKVTSYPVISLFLVRQDTLSHCSVTVLGVGEGTRFCTVPLGAEVRE